jgi:integrase
MLQRRLEEVGSSHAGSLSPVFPSRQGTFIWPHNARRAWRDARQLVDVDLSWVKPHTFRATAGTGVGEVEGALAAAKALGQSDSRTFERFYDDKRRVVIDHTELMDMLLGPFAKWTG